MKPPEATGRLATLGRKITKCRACPRLVDYLAGIKKKEPGFWCRPLPGVGDPKGEVLLVGLAPGARGANRTGRMFTGDHSGQWLYRALCETGFANKPVSKGPGDGLRLRNLYITSAGRCAPPENKPTSGELAECRHWLEEEFRLLPHVRVFLGVGKVGHDAILKLLALSPSRFPFAHGARHDAGEGKIILDTYHCSRRNTNTGTLTWKMWIGVFRKARRLVTSPPSRE